MITVHNGETELSIQLPSSHPLTAPVHPPERVTGPPELHHSEGRYPPLILGVGRTLNRYRPPVAVIDIRLELIQELCLMSMRIDEKREEIAEASSDTV